MHKRSNISKRIIPVLLSIALINTKISFVSVAEDNLSPAINTETVEAATPSNAEFIIEFENPVSKIEIPTESEIYFSAYVVENATASNGIRYYLENALDNGQNISEIAEIDNLTGEFTAISPGYVTVIARKSTPSNATASNSEEFITAEARHNVLIAKREDSIDLLRFEEFEDRNEVDLILEIPLENVFNGYTAIKEEGDNGEIQYSISSDEIGISIDESTGIISYNDYDLIAAAMLSEDDRIIRLTVTAYKAAGTIMQEGEVYGEVLYPEKNIEYVIKIQFALSGNLELELAGALGNHDWYTSDVNVQANDSDYLITDFLSEEFASIVTISDEGVNNKFFYIKNEYNNQIMEPILIENIKIDKSLPTGLRIRYSEPAYSELEIGRLSYYREYVDITLSATDTISGIERFEWTYDRDAEASLINIERQNGTLSGESRTFRLSAEEAAQYRGKISFTVIDNAGNTNTMFERNETLILDNIAPVISVTLNEPVEIYNEKEYYANIITVNIEIEEANFKGSDVSIIVYENESTEGERQNVIWERELGSDIYTTNIVLENDGDYVVQVTYIDCSENEARAYISPTLVLDNTIPQIEFSYNESSQQAEIKIIEHNFRAADLENIEIDSFNILGENIVSSDIETYLINYEWTQNGDEYTAIIEDLVEARYNIAFNYKDISGNQADTCNTNLFIVDRTLPSNLRINYETPLTERILSTVTFGYYKPSVVVYFEAQDNIAGVNEFRWRYLKETGASNANIAIEEGTVPAVLNGNISTAAIILSGDNARQYRGNMAFEAVDTLGNISNRLTDTGHVLVVDSINPTRTVEKSSAIQSIGNKEYFNSDIIFRLIVTEANFYSEDVNIQVTRNGNGIDRNVSWTSDGSDTHIANIQLTGDGEYIISVSYTDRSNNSMEIYESELMIIDTTKPNINIEYENKLVIRNVGGVEYYDKPQTAIITINDMNFRASDVKLIVKATDIIGETVLVENFESFASSSSNWTSAGDNNRLKVEFIQDANYSIDISCKDLAENSSVISDKENFTVDKTAPKNLTIEYSESVLENMLETVSFGYYNAKVNVKVTAEDDTSSIQKIIYNYKKADNVSMVNIEARNLEIQFADIQFSENGKKATSVFSIPKDELTSNGQFNGTVDFTVYDTADNNAYKDDGRRLIIDNISPEISVSYNSPINNISGISYYSGAINIAITVNEANFYNSDISVKVIKDAGEVLDIIPNWSDNSLDSYVGTLVLSEDGAYQLNVSYGDRSGNIMPEYQSEVMIIDSISPTINVAGIANGTANNDEGDIGFEMYVTDENYEILEIQPRLTAIVQNESGKLEEKIVEIGDSRNIEGEYVYSISNLVEDGIYTLVCTVKDAAGNYTEDITVLKSNNELTKSMEFSVNRNGSTFMLDDNTNKVVDSHYVKNVDNNVIMIEINVNPLNSYDILLNNIALEEGKDYLVEQSGGEGKWYRYTYKVNKEVFKQEQEYTIVTSSVDAAKNEAYSDVKSCEVSFVVDRTAPKIAISGLVNNGRYKSEQQIVTLLPSDDGGELRSIKVNIMDRNGTIIDTPINYSGESFKEALIDGGNKLTFNINEGMYQKVNIICDDYALDISGSSNVYNEVYTDITVSSSSVAILWANKKLRLGIILLSIALLTPLTALFIKITKNNKKM